MSQNLAFISTVLRCLQGIGQVLIHCRILAGGTLLLSVILYYIVGGVLPLFVLCVAGTGILYHLEDQLLYHPDIPPQSRLCVSLPSTFGLPFESVYTRSADGTLIHMFVILQPRGNSATAPTLLFLHGNAGNVGHRLHNVVGFYHSLHCNIVMLEYRGYGLSEGMPSEEGLYMDVKAALDFISSKEAFNHREIILFGRSLGGAVAIDAACHPIYSQKIWCLVVENSFTSIPDMARILLGWRIMKKLPLFCFKSKFLSELKISQVKVPTLFISGLSDTLVPPRMMKKLHELCPSENKKLVEFPAGTHNDTWNCQGYYQSIMNFLQDVRARSSEIDS